MTRCLITAGPTREHIDPVRFLSNGSSGRMGYALAAAAAARGWSVDLVSGPVSLPAPEGVNVRRVVSADEMFAACEPLFAKCDVFIAVAAVCDFKPRFRARDKIKKASAGGKGNGANGASGASAADGGMSLELAPTVDILKTLAAKKNAAQCVVGFAAETRDVEDYARKKLAAKNLDWIVANDVGRPGIGMDAADNAIVMLSRAGVRVEFGPAPKEKVAGFILRRIEAGA